MQLETTFHNNKINYFNSFFLQVCTQSKNFIHLDFHLEVIA